MITLVGRCDDAVVPWCCVRDAKLWRWRRTRVEEVRKCGFTGGKSVRAVRNIIRLLERCSAQGDDMRMVDRQPRSRQARRYERGRSWWLCYAEPCHARKAPESWPSRQAQADEDIGQEQQLELVAKGRLIKGDVLPIGSSTCPSLWSRAPRSVLDTLRLPSSPLLPGHRPVRAQICSVVPGAA